MPHEAVKRAIMDQIRHIGRDNACSGMMKQKLAYDRTPMACGQPKLQRDQCRGRPSRSRLWLYLPSPHCFEKRANSWLVTALMNW